MNIHEIGIEAAYCGVAITWTDGGRIIQFRRPLDNKVGAFCWHSPLPESPKRWAFSVIGHDGVQHAGSRAKAYSACLKYAVNGV